MEQQESGRLLLHLLFAQTQLRGSGITDSHGRTQPIEIIEDVVPIFGVSCRLRMDRAPKKIFSAYSGEELEFVHSQGFIRFTVPKVDIHELAVIQC
jgi:hypothetical protein